MTTLIGVNTSATDTALTDGTTFGVNNQHYDHSGNVWVYVKASAAFTLGDCVGIRPTGRATPLTLTLAKTAIRRVGFAQVATAADSYAWVQIHGTINSVRVAIDCEPKVSLYPTATAGVLDDATASVIVHGVCIDTSATAAGAFAGNASFPTLTRGANLSQI
jgi:hypothetical protein